LTKGRGSAVTTQGKVRGGFHVAAIDGPEKRCESLSIGWFTLAWLSDQERSDIVSTIEDGQAESVFAIGRL
jgi:hypothetical protein